jgi:LuxR family transcriptional regulator, maltose regulon positive regulatory protein
MAHAAATPVGDPVPRIEADGHERLVPRRRLLDRLLAERDPVVVLLVAPAGYGKSTLLSQWRDADERPFASVTLAERHNDPILLVSGLVDALAAIEPVDAGLLTAIGGVHPDLAEVVLPRLAETIRTRSQPFVLALDDVHALRGEATTVLAALVEAIPEGSALALAGREEPALPLGRLRARRLLGEIRAADLAMTVSEAAELVRLTGTELGADAVKALTHRTEGWPAALYLATISLRDSRAPEVEVDRFRGDDRIVSDYVRDELLASLDPDDRDFMIRTSVLEELSGDGCDSLLGAEGSAERLRRLSRSNLLLIPLDHRDDRFRCHALLRDALAGELRRLGADVESELQGRAAEWLAAGGDVEGAVQHAIAAADSQLAGRVIWPVASDYASHGREATLRMWAESLGPRAIERSPELCLMAATLNLAAGDGPEIERWTALVAAASDGSEPDHSLQATARLIRATGATRGTLQDAREEAVAAARDLPDVSPWRSLAHMTEGSTEYLFGGDPQRAIAALESGARGGSRDAPSVEAVCRSQLALIALDRGDAITAADEVDKAAADHRLYGLHQAPAHALIFAVSALLRAGQGRTDEAGREMRTAVDLLARLNAFSAWYEAETRIVLARAAILLDDAGGSRTLLQAAGRHLRAVPDAVVLHDWMERAWRDADSAGAVAGRWPLTPAELRVLHLLPTHLSFREIADELFVSTNTIKTQARSIYRKLGVSSRTEAVACARTAGLLGGAGEPKP